MTDRTQRGDAEQKQDDGEMQGQPAGAVKARTAGQSAGTTTRDKSITPAKETSGDDDAAER